MSGSLSSVEGELNAIVKEYLELSNLNHTLRAFEIECQKIGKPIQDDAGKSRRDEKVSKIQNELLQYFDQGQRLEFFSAWERHVNPEVRDRDLYCQKLEFNLHIHFAVLPLRKKDHWVKEEVDEAMYHFRYYLDTRGSVLSRCSELLPFYALPYVHGPSTHPSFQEVFQISWVKKLRNNLENFIWEDLKRKFRQDVAEPRLVELYKKNDFELKDVRNELTSTERRLEDSEKRYVTQSRKLDKLQEDCQQLMSVASLLVTALESAVKGDIVDLDCVLSTCTERFPETYKLRKCDSEPENHEHVAELERTNCLESEITEDLSSKQSLLNPEEFLLNFAKVRKDLCGSDERRQMLLLQALRWRLTKAATWNEKEKALTTFVDNDLLSIQENSGQMMFVEMMSVASERLLQSITRFLNALASFSKGRAYLSESPALLGALLDHMLHLPSKDSCIRDMILGALQKLSMRSVSQTTMIEAGAIEWLAEALDQRNSLSDYGLEYAVALLMNLCLCPLGRRRCEPLKEKLLLILGQLLQLNKQEIIGYVNGALYSMLSLPTVRQYAKEQHFEETLLIVMQQSEPEAKKQLECIHQLLHAGGSNDLCSSEEEDTEDEEETDLEPELEWDDPVDALPGETVGECLLSQHYSTTVSGSECQGQQLEDKVEPIRRLNDSTHTCSNSLLHLNPVDGSSYDAEGVRSLSVPPRMQIAHPTSSDAECRSLSEPVTPKLDVEATQLVRKIVGQPSTTLVEAAIIPNPASVNIRGLNVNEYTVAFSSRPKIPRTPELSPSNSTRARQSSSEKAPTAPRSRESDIGIGSSCSGMSPKVAASSPPPHTPKTQRDAKAEKKYSSSSSSIVKN